MGKNILLTEFQLKKYLKSLVREDYDIERFSNAGGDETKPLKATFDTNLRTIRGARQDKDDFKERYNNGFYSKDINSIVRYVPFDDEHFVINPVSKTLYLSDGTTKNCWALGPLTNADYNHAIKKDELSTYANPVYWEQGGEDKLKNNNTTCKDLLLSYCATYFAKLIPLVCNVENVNVNNIKYIAWPESSASFNNDFVTKYLMPALKNNNINIENIIPNIVGKSNELISINYDLAKWLGCDDIDIKTLQMFISEQEEITSTIKLRKEVDNLLNGIKDVLAKNNTEEFYQYSTYNKQKEDSTYSDSDLSHTTNGNDNTGLYLDASKEWRSTDTNLDKVNVRKKGQRKDREYVIDKKTKDAVEKLIKLKNNIIAQYDSAGEKQKKIANSNTLNYKGKEMTLSDYGFKHFNTRKENANNVNANGGHTSGRFLDDMVDDDGKLQNSKWEIKHLPEVYRRVLDGLFVIKGQEESTFENFDRDATMLLFDDNVAGGSTMSKVCDALLNGTESSKWKSIIPITISLMEMTQGVTKFQISKQKEFRDKEMELFGEIPLTQQAKESMRFWSGDENGLKDITDDISQGKDMASIYASQNQSESQHYKTARILQKSSRRVRVFSLPDFVKFCQKEGLNDSNVEELHPNWVFIEIGSTLKRLQFDMGRTRNYDRRKYRGKNSTQNAANDFYKNGRFFFKSNHKNVLRIEFDDNMKIGDGKRGSTSVKFKGSEVVKDKNGRNSIISPNKNVEDSKTYNGRYFGAVGFSAVEDETFEFIENKINEIGDDIMFFIHCEQGASRSAALGYYITKRINDDVNYYLRKHSYFGKRGNYKGSQFRIGKTVDSDGKATYRTMHNTIFNNLGRHFDDEYGEHKHYNSDKDIRNFIDKYVPAKKNNADDDVINENILSDLLKELAQ